MRENQAQSFIDSDHNPEKNTLRKMQMNINSKGVLRTLSRSFKIFRLNAILCFCGLYFKIIRTLKNDTIGN